MSEEPEKKKRYRPQPTKPAVESDDDLIGVQDVLNLTQWSIDTLNRRVAAGEYPQPIEGKSGRDRKWARKQHKRWVERMIAKADKAA